MLSTLQKGEPNLVVVPPSDVLSVVLSLYMANQHLPLPGPDEVLMCSESTSAEEIELLWLRAIGDARDQKRGKIYCLVNAHMLIYEVCQQFEKCLSKYQNCQNEYCLVVICSNSDQSHITNIIHASQHRSLIISSEIDSRKYLMSKFTEHSKDSKGAWLADGER
ncbi:hypothetical protein CAPTEDRAFT_216802 [Capitella teleta]|uniref:Uncharacterized protein n=1 Tax=Capitella teleta TaxID=283909 RepID=R7U245_CAPTE|nr:hypothetical protein CAPTEDRAFT_216802 [Capitella teleta]|eukprot:ELU00405.1 hypothetical protein CAPTEDRAFT_216802 [Capitella teleta]